MTHAFGLVFFRSPRASLPSALFFLVLFVAGGVAYGQLSVSPTIVEPRAYPGGLSRFTVSVSNTGRDTLDCTVSVKALQVNGGMPVAVDNAPRSCREWITSDASEFALRPRVGRRMVFQVRPGREAAGGYYAAVMVHGVPRHRDQGANENAEGTRAGVRFSYKVMTAVLLTVPAPRMEARIDAAQPIVRASEKGSGYSVVVPVRNQGNIHARMSGYVEIRSEAGQKLDRFELAAGRGFILPGDERLFRSKGQVNLPDGLYTARVRLTPEKFRRPMQKEFAFHVRDGEPDFSEVSDALQEKLRTRSAGFTVSPPELAVTARAGGQRMQAVQLTNLTKETIPVRAATLEWRRDARGTDLVQKAEPGHGRSGSGMITLRTKEFELRPMGRRRVPVTIALPPELEGERYAAICFERTDMQLDASPRSRARRSALLYLKARDTGRAQAEIAAFTTERLASGAVKLTARLKNTGSVSVEPQARFYIDDEHGDALDRVAPETRPASVQAGGESMVSALWDKVLAPGDYTARVSLRYDPNKPPLAARAKLTVPGAETAHKED